MENAIHIDQNAGRIAYNAWREEFSPYEEEWDELTETAKDAWECVADAVLHDRIRLPSCGVEVTFRTRDFLRGFAWTGVADTEMKDIVTHMLFRAMSGELK